MEMIIFFVTLAHLLSSNLNLFIHTCVRDINKYIILPQLFENDCFNNCDDKILTFSLDFINYNHEFVFVNLIIYDVTKPHVGQLDIITWHME